MGDTLVAQTQREIEAHYNEKTGEVELYQIVTVEDFVENPKCAIPVANARVAWLYCCLLAPPALP